MFILYDGVANNTQSSTMSRKITPKVEYLQFASKINMLIDEREGGSKEEFSRKIGCSYETVRRWCLGNNLPDGAQMLELHRIYNVSLDRLLTDEKNKTGEMESWAVETQEACRTVKRIIESPDKKTAKALLSNLEAFSLSLDRFEDKQEQDYKISELKQSSESLKNELKELKEAVRRLSETGSLGAHTGID
jgi:transcriptional regulator with XRE-family HTH domain